MQSIQSRLQLHSAPKDTHCVLRALFAIKVPGHLCVESKQYENEYETKALFLYYVQCSMLEGGLDECTQRSGERVEGGCKRGGAPKIQFI